MKKALYCLIILVSIFIVGCSKSNAPYTKEVNEYKITHTNVEKDIAFEFVNDEAYKVTETNGSIRLYNELNKSKIELYFYYDYPAQKTITKEKHEFALKSNNNYKKVKVNDYEGWSVYLTTSLYSNYEINLILTEEDEEGKVYAVDIKVIDSPVKVEEYPFNTKEFVEGEDFQHLLNSLKVVDKEVEIEESN